MRPEIGPGIPVPGEPRHAVRVVEEMVPYLHVADRVAGKAILEVECGSGFGAHHLAGLARRVHAYDGSAATVAWARTHYPAPNLSFRVLGVEPGPEPGAYDRVVSFHLLDRARRPADHVRRLARSAAPGAEVYVAVRNRRVPQARLARLGRGLAPEELADLLMPQFREVRILGITPNAKVRAYREHRRRELRSLPPLQRFQLGVLPGRWRGPSEIAADAQVRRHALGAGAPSPLGIEPDDFIVAADDVGSAERLLALCASEGPPVP